MEPASSAVQRVGEALRDARVARGLSLEDMAASLRIPRAHLAAIEEGRVGDLPAPVYALGFVRVYARALGLDEEEAVRRWREASSGAAAARRAPELVFPGPAAERRPPGGAPVLAGAAALVVVAGALLGWWLWSGEDGGRSGAEAVPPPPAQQAAAPGAGGTAPGPAGAPAGVRPPDVPPPTGAIAPPPPPAGGPAQPPAAAPAAGTARPPGDGRILLRARDVDVWIQVRERAADGPVVADRVLRPGEGWAVPARDGLVLSTGNAAALEVVVDGEPVPAGLGPGPAVRRGVPLDPDRLRAAAPRRPAAR
jgi:cytoskeleton protein RodZ